MHINKIQNAYNAYVSVVEKYTASRAVPFELYQKTKKTKKQAETEITVTCTVKVE